MKHNYHWHRENVNLLNIAISTRNSVDISFILGNTSDGEEIAEIQCSKVVLLNMQSTIETKLPIFVGDVTVEVVTNSKISQSLRSNNYGFFYEDGNSLSSDIDTIYMIRIEGGEIDVKIVAACINIKG